MCEKDYEDVLNFLFAETTSIYGETEEQNRIRFAIRCSIFKQWISSLKIYFFERIPIIHVAGTKGKGSVCSMLDSCLRYSGKNTGLFTSPHLYSPRERIRINGELISKEDLIRISNNIKSMCTVREAWYKDEKSQVTDENFKIILPEWFNFFDRFLLVALQWFSERKVEFVILECGIGGRFDSTNFAREPVVCVITNISLDHQAILGDNLMDIASQKAGIMKKGIPIFTSASQNEAVKEVFKRIAVETGASLLFVSNNTEIEHSIGDRIDLLDDQSVSLQGTFQKENISLVIAVMRHLSGQNNIQQHFVNSSTLYLHEVPHKPFISFNWKLIQEGLKNTVWPCRFELMKISGTNWVIDGAHNEYSIEQLFISVKER